jgi:hypothetical protein
LQVLEGRLLLSTYPVPANHSAVYLTHETAHPGWVDVHLDAPANPVEITLTDTSDTINASSYSGFHFYDLVPAYYKPSGGIHFHAGSVSYLQVGNPDANTSEGQADREEVSAATLAKW